MVPHLGVVNYLTWCRGAYPISDGCGAPLCSPLASDMSVTSLFLPLISGSRVVILDGDDPVESLDAALRGQDRFSFVKVTPTHLDALRHLCVGTEPPRNTRAFVVGGEALRGDVLTLWRHAAPDLLVFNEYGPTETVVGCAVHATVMGDIDDGDVPIGRPIANTRLYVLDGHRQPVPIGVAGELYIAGAGVARGYVNDPVLTAERFVPDPFCDASGERMYRTGDLVRYRGDGTLEFLGRIDRQLKIRGYRVEPGEVEAAIRHTAQVSDVVVAARDLGGGDRQLVAYVVLADRPETVDELGEIRDAIRSSVRHTLPGYMVPGVVRFVDAIPMTASGKTDISRLESGTAVDDGPAREWVRPETPLERIVAATFQDVLKCGPVGARDDFFAHLGGHSLLATKVVARLRELLRVELPLRRLFEAPTVQHLARSMLADSSFGAHVEEMAAVLIDVLSMTDSQVADELSASPRPSASEPSDVPPEAGGH
jgi:hypothetical protein